MSLTEPEARRLTTHIHLSLTTLADGRDRLLGYIRDAKDGQAHEALGYVSWTAYVSEEFGAVLPRLSRDERQPVVAELAAMGMSTRAIAPIVGVHHDTVAADVRAIAPVGNPTPQPEEPQSPVGSSPSAEAGEPATPPSQDPASADTPQTEETGEASAMRPPSTVDPVSSDPPKVVGLDGKSYSRPARTDAQRIEDAVADDPGYQAAKYRASLTKLLSQVSGVGAFDPDRVTEVADDITYLAIDSAFANVRDWHERVTQRRRKLRVVEGGAR